MKRKNPPRPKQDLRKLRTGWRESKLSFSDVLGYMVLEIFFKMGIRHRLSKLEKKVRDFIFLPTGLEKKGLRGRPKKEFGSPPTELWILRTIAEEDGVSSSRLRRVLMEKTKIADKRGVMRHLRKLEKDGMLASPRKGFWQLSKQLEAYTHLFRKFYGWFRKHGLFDGLPDAWSGTLLQLAEYQRRMEKKYGRKKLRQIQSVAVEAVEAEREFEVPMATRLRLWLILANQRAVHQDRLHKLASEKLKLQRRSLRAHLQEMSKEKAHLFYLPLEIEKELPFKSKNELKQSYEELRKNFELVGHILSEKARIRALSKTEWVVTDVEEAFPFWQELSPFVQKGKYPTAVLEKKYVISKIGNLLEVYGKILSEGTLVRRRGIKVWRINHWPEAYAYIYLKFQDYGDKVLIERFRLSHYSADMARKYGDEKLAEAVRDMRELKFGPMEDDWSLVP